MTASGGGWAVGGNQEGRGGGWHVASLTFVPAVAARRGRHDVEEREMAGLPLVSTCFFVACPLLPRLPAGIAHSSMT